MKLIPRIPDWHRSEWAKCTAIVAAMAGTLALLIYMVRPGPTVNRETIVSTAQSKISDPGTTTSRYAINVDEGGFSIRPEVASERVITPGMPDGLATVLASQPQRLTRLEAAFQRWHQNHPKLAGKLIDLLCFRLGAPQSSSQEQVWTSAELLTAVDLVLGLDESEDRLPFLSEIAAHLASVDPASALGLLGSFKSDAEKEQFVGEVLGGWVKSDPGAALRWVRAEPSGPARETMLDRVVQTVVQTDPAAAGSIVAEHFESPQAQASAARTVVGRWAAVDAPGAADWLSHFPPGDLRMEMLHVLVVSWRGRDETSFAKWAEGLPAGDLRQQTEALWKRLAAESDTSAQSKPSGI